MAIYILMELVHKTRTWTVIESTGDNTLALERLLHLRNTNGSSADYKLEYILGVPDKPWS